MCAEIEVLSCAGIFIIRNPPCMLAPRLRVSRHQPILIINISTAPARTQLKTRLRQAHSARPFWLCVRLAATAEYPAIPPTRLSPCALSGVTMRNRPPVKRRSSFQHRETGIRGAEPAGGSGGTITAGYDFKANKRNLTVVFPARFISGRIYCF